VRLTAVSALFVVATAGITFLALRSARQRRDAAALEMLRATAQLQSELVSRLIAEHERNAEIFAGRETVWSWLGPSRPRVATPRARADFARAIERTRAAYQCDRVVVLDQHAQIVASTARSLASDERRFYQQVLRARRTLVQPLRVGSAGAVEYGVAAPIFANGDSTRRVIGVVGLVKTLGTELQPLIPRVRNARSGEETVLLHPEGDSATVVGGAPPHDGVGVLTVRVPLNDLRFVEAQLATQPQAAVARGLDYRRVHVLAAGTAVAGTAWLLMAKVDETALQARWRPVNATIIGAALFTILMAAFLLRIQRLEARRRDERARLALASKYLAATKTSMDGFGMLARDGRLLDVNRALEQITGFTREELLERSLADILGMRAPDVEQWLAGLFDRPAARFERQWRRKDGAVISVDVSTSLLVVDDEPQLACYLRDVTEQKETTNRLERMNALYRFHISAGEALQATKSVQAAYDAVCRTAVEEGGLQFAWIGVPDETTGLVRVAARAGSASDYADELVLPLQPPAGVPAGATATCLQEARTIIINDFAISDETVPWHAAARSYGLESSATLPIMLKGRAAAAATFYAAAPEFFTDEMLVQLGQLTRNLSLIVQSAASESQRQVEASRREAVEARFETLFDASPLPMCVVDVRDGRLDRVNKAFEATFGYSPASTPTQRALFDAMIPDPAYRAELDAIYARDVNSVLAEPGTTRTSPELRLRCRNGGTLVVQAAVASVGDQLILTFADVTALRANEALLEEADRAARLGRWSYDYTTREVTTSRGFLSALGFHDSVRTIDPGPDVPWLLNLLHPSELARSSAIIAHGEDVDTTVRARAEGDRERFLRVRVHIDRDDSGQPLRATGSFQDVSEDVLASRELTRLRDHLQDVVQERTSELALANAALQRTDERLKAMLEVSQRSSLFSESEIYRFGVAEAARITDSRFGYLCSVNDDQTQARYVSWWDEHGHSHASMPKDEYPIAGNVLWQSAVQDRAPSLRDDPAMPAGCLSPGALPAAVGRQVVVPIVDGGRVRLLLGVAGRTEPYDASDVQELQLLGHDVFGIAERRRMELALHSAFDRLRASERLFAVAMEASSAGVWELNVAQRQMTYSASHAQLLGYAPEELTNTLDAWWQLVHHEDRAAAMEKFAEALKSDDAFNLEFRVRAKDDSYLWVLSRGRVVQRDVAGDAQRVVGSHTDLSARREAEEQLRLAKERADDASRAKSSFLAVMSHEIRTPLNGVIAMAEVLAQSPLPPHDLEAVQIIRSSANVLLGVIDDILDFSKIEAGRMEIDLADVSLAALSEELAESLLPVARARDVRLHVFVAPEIPRVVRCDPTRVRQILVNLAGNAIKFSAGREGTRGQVSLRLELEQVDPLVIGIDVTDNGIGMSADTLRRLFSSFSQGEVSTTRKFGGSGLGLAICRRLIDLMHGEISVKSTLGVGTTFHVCLPVSPVDARPAAVPDDLTGVQCVLVTHGDHGVLVNDLQRALSYAGATVRIVPDEQEGVRAARATGAGVIILHDCRHDGAPSGFPAYRDVPDARHVMLTPGRRGAPRKHSKNIVTIDAEHFRAHRICGAVAVAAGRASPDAATPTIPRPLRHTVSAPISVDAARASGRLILVVEDDLTNQRVILRQLRVLGYAAEVAENGAVALEMIRQTRYALVLSDLHMPVMDGYTLSESVRREEPAGARLPIIALTANALRGEAARAEAAGMDAYLTKPVPLATLKGWLERFIPPVADPPPTDAASSPPPTDNASNPPNTVTPDAESVPALQIAILASLVGDDPAVLREFLADFRASAAALSAEIAQAERNGDLAQVGALAHRLKSSARSVGAVPLGDVCAELEKAGKLGHAAMVAERRLAFDALRATVDAEIEAYLGQP